ncbi:polymer-forming cytoskeletal protein [Phenylobacterium sp.]|uniref:bactofilin family protein n=1 Tax=Phenylobacterium sp. TaxID=1871053 RepID=UPI0027301C62|nr:polymer-forming cytoskeletal protein [Phenylobacterium sp.]MDP1619129.1 polymer-forming cytoskeletal protein [Phenylobacterium sp.]MDP1987651.1 polymer-forming cytoskeletal protein [Phenylobacterium sp.]
MFDKSSKTISPRRSDNDQLRVPAPAPVAKPKPASLIGLGLCVQGDIAGEAEVQIDGLVRGDIRVGKLTLGPQGRIEGSVVAVIAEIRGHVKGPMKARQVRLYGTAHIEGDIAHEQLAMETGAVFEGRSVRLPKSGETEPQVTTPPAAVIPA